MLFDLHVQVAHRLVGLSPAALFQQATGLSRMTYQRGRGYAALMASREKTGAPTDSLLLRMMQKRDITPAEFQDNIPSGISALMVHGMGLLDDGCTQATRELVEQFDASDLRLCRIPEHDLPGFLAELGPASSLGPAYCAQLCVSGFRKPTLDIGEAGKALLHLALRRRAHMALSFLAAVDHEMGRWNDRLTGHDAMAGHARFSVLLMPAEPRQRKRLKPLDPMARLVDVVGAAGFRARTGDWPEKPLTVTMMGASAERSGVMAGDGARFVRALRGSKHPMTRSAFRLLIASQFRAVHTPTYVLDAAADQLEPYLVAAHLLTLLIPDHPKHKHHLDRMGWRDAYLDWWARHADRYPPPMTAPGATPPKWLLNP